MKLFQFVLNLCEMMGIVPLHPYRNCSLNLNTICILLCISLFFIFSVVFAMFKAQTAEEYGDSIYMSIGEFGAVVNFSLTIWKMPHILILIKKFEELIEKSKSHRFFYLNEPKN